MCICKYFHEYLIAEKAKITIEQTIEAIQKFYTQVFVLVFRRKLEFEKFGSFLLNGKRDIIFVPDIHFCYIYES